MKCLPLLTASFSFHTGLGHGSWWKEQMQNYFPILRENNLWVARLNLLNKIQYVRLPWFFIHLQKSVWVYLRVPNMQQLYDKWSAWFKFSLNYVLRAPLHHRVDEWLGRNPPVILAMETGVWSQILSYFVLKFIEKITSLCLMFEQSLTFCLPSAML